MFFFCKQKTAYELRISDWSSDVCSSDLGSIEELAGLLNIEPATLRASIERFNGFVRQNRDDDFHRGERAYDRWIGDRKSVVEGKSVSVRVDLGGRRILKKKLISR